MFQHGPDRTVVGGGWLGPGVPRCACFYTKDLPLPLDSDTRSSEEQKACVFLPRIYGEFLLFPFSSVNSHVALFLT